MNSLHFMMAFPEIINIPEVVNMRYFVTKEGLKNHLSHKTYKFPSLL